LSNEEEKGTEFIFFFCHEERGQKLTKQKNKKVTSLLSGNFFFKKDEGLIVFSSA